MSLFWEGNQVPQFVIVDLDDRVIIDVAYNENEATSIAIEQAFGKTKSIEVYVSTGFSKWRDTSGVGSPKVE